MMKINYSLNDLPSVAEQVLEKSKSKVLLFYASMGTGKTTLIKELANQLGSTISSSPTFSLVNEYETDCNNVLFHFDFYRIEDEEEALDIGIEEYFYSNKWCFIEWPENIENLVPLDAQVIKIETNKDNTRTLFLH